MVHSANGQALATLMKNKVNPSITSLSSAAFLLMIVLLYVLVPTLAISINRSLEMMSTGSAKGLMMIYYQYGAWAFLFAGLTHMIQVLGVVFKGSVVSEACYGLFSPLSAKAILLISGLMAVTFAYGLGNSIRRGMMGLKSLKPWTEKLPKLKGKLEYGALVLVFACIALGPGLMSLLLYGFGLIRLDYKKVLVVSTLGFIIFH